MPNPLREVERLNRRVNGGWVTITAHPIFGSGRWVIQIEPVGVRVASRFTIATGFNLRAEIRAADRWLDKRVTTDGEFQVAAYLDTAEYVEWARSGLAPANPQAKP